MDNKIKKRKTMHLKDFDYTNDNYVYFVTMCAENKQRCFVNNKITKIIEDELEFRRTTKEINLLCYCIMPDHLHILLSLTEDYHKSLQNWVSAFKRYTTRVINELFSIKPLWQKNFYDHVVRKEESLIKIAEYIVNNPVRKGIVSEWEKYPYSKIVE